MAETDMMRDSGMSDNMSDVAERAKNAVQETADQAKAKMSEFGRTAANKMEEGRRSAASGLESAASSLRNRAQSGSGSMSEFANRAADRLQSTASYVRDHDMNDMMGDLGQVVRQNPGPSLIAAAAVGFLLGVALRRDD